MNIPIYRAKKIDSDEYVNGFYLTQDYIGDYINEDKDEREESLKHFIHGGTSHDTWEDEEGFFQFYGIDEIDISTLQISFDNKNWYLVETVLSAVKLLENTTIEDFRLKVTGIQE